MKKRLVGLTCMALGVASALDAMGGLFISQYYEGTSNNKWIEIFNPGPDAVDLAASVYRLGIWANDNREAWKTGGAGSSPIVLSGSVGAGATYLIKNSSAALPSYAAEDQSSGALNFNGDDSVVLFTGLTYAYANVVDAFGLTGNTAVDKSFVRKNTVTNGVNTDFNAADWDEFTLTAVNEAGEGLNQRLGYHLAGEPPVVTNVKFAVSAAIVNEDQGEYLVSIVKNRPEGDVSGSIEISPFSTATLGVDYTLDTTNFTMNGAVTSAVFTMTILDDAEQEGAETLTLGFHDIVGATLTTPISFSLTINPSDQPAYAIAIDPPVNGTVTTTPADMAEAGATVMINATPASGYVVDTYSVVGADSTVIGTSSSFTMPPQAVTVTVTFKAFTGGPLFISEVADPDDIADAKFVELYNSGTESIDLAAGQWYLARQANGTTWNNIALTGSVAAAQTYILAYQAAMYASNYPTAPTPNQVSSSVSGNGDDGYFLYRGGNHTNGVLEDAYGVIDQDGTGMPWEYLDSRAVRQAAVTSASPFWIEAEWTIPATATTADMTPGLHPDSLAVFAVSFDKLDGFTVEAGTGGALTATAVRGTPPYGYAWSSSLWESAADANVFTILPTAPTGTYWAQVVATDSSDPVQAVTNMINFSVVPAAQKYPITITPATNGTVVTAPVGEAAAGTPVSVYATADGGWRVAGIEVVDESSNPISVTGITFLMPATGVTVTVLFEPYVAPDLVIDFETVTGFNSYAAGTSTVSGITLVHSGALRGTTASDHFNGTASARVRYEAANVGFFANANAFSNPISRISFLYSDYGADNTATFRVQVSADGVAWTDAGPVFDPASSNLVEGILDTLPANMTYFKFLMAGGEGDRVNIDDIGFNFGAPMFAVGFDRTEGFALEAGTSDAVTATAVNGTEPYGYAWSSTLDPAHYATNGNVFTILATAPAGSYQATAVVTDASDPVQTATNTIGFHVIVKYAIAITPPVNGTATTTPADEAAAGATVTIQTVPAVGYVVDAITVVDAGMNPVTLTGKTFTMPASAVTVTVTFKPAETVGALIISQYYEGTGQNKWIELYNPGAAAIDLSAEGYRLGQFSNTNREGWKIGVPPTFTVALSNAIPAGSTYLLGPVTASNPVYAVANQDQTANWGFNGDDSIVLFKGPATAFSNVVDAFGLSVAFSNAVDRSYVRTNTLTQGVNTDFNPAEWIEYSLAAVEEAAADVNERLGYHSVSEGEEHPPIPAIVFVAEVGFTFTLPEEYALVRVEGADRVDEISQAWNWAPLSSPGDYTFDGTTVTILSDPADQRMIRIWLQ